MGVTQYAQFIPLMKASTPSAYSAWLARVTALGASPTATKTAAMQAFFASLESDGLLAPNQSGANALYILVGTNTSDTATNRLNEARVNLFQPGTYDATVNSPVGAGSLDDTGITGDGAMYWSTGINPSTHFGARLDDVSLLAAITGSVTGNFIADMGNEGSHGLVCRWHVPLDETFYSLVNAQLHAPANTSGTAALFTATAEGGTYRSYKGSTQQATAARSGTTLSNQELICFARTSNAGPPSSFSSRKYGAFGITSGMDAGDVAALYGHLQTLLAVFGATI
jgi:hypothetical protein